MAGPRHASEGGAETDPLPELLAEVGSEGGKQQEKRPDRIAEHGPVGHDAAPARLALDLLEAVDELDQLRETGVGLQSLQVGGHGPNRLVGTPLHLLLGLGVGLVGSLSGHRRSRRLPEAEIPDAAEKSVAAEEALFAPLDLLLRRRQGEDEEAHRIGAHLLQENLGIHGVPEGLAHLPPVLEDHLVREQRAARQREVDHAGVPQRFGDEAPVEHDRHRDLDAADVEVGRPPARRGRGIAERRVVPRIRRPQVVPRGVDERVHRVGLARGGRAAAGAAAGEEVRARQERVSAPCVAQVLRQKHGQLLPWHRDDAARSAVHDGDGCAPAALARDEPVADGEDRAPRTDSPRLPVPCDGFSCLARQAAAERTTVAEETVLEVGATCGVVPRLARWRGDELAGQAVTLAEDVILTIMARVPHHGARPILGVDVRRDPDGDRLAGERVPCGGAGVDSVEQRRRVVGGADELAQPLDVTLGGGAADECGREPALRRQHEVVHPPTRSR